MPRGRPTKFSEQLAAEILQRISAGENLRAICRDKKITNETVYEWKDKYPDFSERFARARELGADALALEALEIADTPLKGEEVEYNSKGKVIKRKKSDMLGHRRLQVDTRLKLLAKWFPQKYGDKSSVELSGPGGGPVQLSDVERAAKIESILNAAKRRVDGD